MLAQMNGWGRNAVAHPAEQRIASRRPRRPEPFYAPKRLSYVPSTATFALRFCTS
jgi:hypothetical protein